MRAAATVARPAGNGRGWPVRGNRVKRWARPFLLSLRAQRSTPARGAHLDGDCRACPRALGPRVAWRLTRKKEGFAPKRRPDRIFSSRAGRPPPAGGQLARTGGTGLRRLSAVHPIALGRAAILVCLSQSWMLLWRR